MTGSPVGRVLRRACLWALLTLATLALAQSSSEPAVGLPRPPDATSADVHIADLADAPPIAREPIVDLVLLGAYPLDDDMRAFPNQLLDVRTAAFMLTNLFALRDLQQFPVPMEEAYAFYDVLTGSEDAPDDIVTAGGLRNDILTFASLVVEDTRAVAIALDEEYPALRAGNPDTPLTRAGAALMLAIALRTLTQAPA